MGRKQIPGDRNSAGMVSAFLMETEMEKIEYRVRPVTRYIVTRYEAAPMASDDVMRGAGSISTKGEYDNAEVAYQVGYALCKAEHDLLGWPAGDERIQYPAKSVEGVMIGSGGKIFSF